MPVPVEASKNTAVAIVPDEAQAGPDVASPSSAGLHDDEERPHTGGRSGEKRALDPETGSGAYEEKGKVEPSTNVYFWGVPSSYTEFEMNLLVFAAGNVSAATTFGSNSLI